MHHLLIMASSAADCRSAISSCNSIAKRGSHRRRGLDISRQVVAAEVQPLQGPQRRQLPREGGAAQPGIAQRQRHEAPLGVAEVWRHVAEI